MKRFLCLNAGAALLLLLLTMFTPQQMHATVILEGSDAIGFHCAFGDAGACTYRDEVWSAIGGVDPRSIAVIGNTVNNTAVGSGTHAVMDFATVQDAITAAGPGGLSNYVAVYFLAGGGCCAEDDNLITAPGAAGAVGAYLTGGGTVMIENYNGGTAWDFAVGAGGAGNSHVAGVAGSLPGSTCTDGETVSATGLTNGFVQPPALGCWEHQAYDQSFFGGLGFTMSFFDADPGYAALNPTLGPFSGLLSNGSTVVGASAVPEPSSIAVLSGLLLLGAGAIRRRRAQQ